MNYCSLFLVVFFFNSGFSGEKNKKIKYAETVHQYIVQQAYELLKYQKGEAANIKTHVGQMHEYSVSGYQHREPEQLVGLKQN